MHEDLGIKFSPPPKIDSFQFEIAQCEWFFLVGESSRKKLLIMYVNSKPQVIVTSVTKVFQPRSYSSTTSRSVYMVKLHHLEP